MTTAKEPKKKPESKADPEQPRHQSEDHIDYSEIPKADAAWYERAEFVQPGFKTLKANLDRDMVEWYKAQWPKYRNKMNQVLRSHMEKDIEPPNFSHPHAEKMLVVGKFDPEVISWLKSDKDFEARMSNVLRDFMDWYKRKGYDNQP